MSARRPNSGPYVVTYSLSGVEKGRDECHTWADACKFMRDCLVMGYDVAVVFA
jgi:hypothetical protein